MEIFESSLGNLPPENGIVPVEPMLRLSSATTPDRVEFIFSRSELEQKVILMHLEGWSIRSLSRYFRLGRNRIRRILRNNEYRREQGQTALPPPPKKPSCGGKLAPYEDRMRQLLEKYPKITAVRMREELSADGYQGGLSILKERLRQLRPLPKREGVIRFETDPGIQGQMDWSPYTIDFTAKGKRTVLCFSYILGFSRRQYIDFATHRDFFTLIRRHVDAFGYFGGLPRQCLYDNEKTVVLRWEAGRPVFNPAFIDFITHYQCKPVACRPGRAQTKGKVERPFQYVEGNLLNARSFVDLEDLRACGRWWMAERSDTHIHETTGHPPLELFLADEKSRLLPLPAHPYDCGQVVLLVCSIDGFLEFETNRYSVPFDYVGDILALKATEQEILIYSPYIELIATHGRRPNGEGAVCEESAHRKAENIRYGLEPVRDAFERMGEEARIFLAGLQGKHPHRCGFYARRILLLKDRYNADDINRACKRACLFHAYDAGAVERILHSIAIPRSLESIRNEKARIELEKRLPPIKQRSLSEYGHLFGKDAPHAEKRSDPGEDPQPPQNPAPPSNAEGT